MGADVLSESPCQLHAVSLFLFSFSRDDNAHQTHAVATAELSDRPAEQEAQDASPPIQLTVSLLALSLFLCLCFVYGFQTVVCGFAEAPDHKLAAIYGHSKTNYPC